MREQKRLKIQVRDLARSHPFKVCRAGGGNPGEFGDPPMGSLKARWIESIIITAEPEWGIDAEIEFKNVDGQASG